MNANEILKKHEDANEMHFHEVDREWIIEAMEEYAALRQTLVMRSYKAGMMQGFRILQSCMTFQQQKDFGFTDNDGKINERLENEWQRWLKDNYA